MQTGTEGKIERISKYEDLEGKKYILGDYNTICKPKEIKETWSQLAERCKTGDFSGLNVGDYKIVRMRVPKAAPTLNYLDLGSLMNDNDKKSFINYPTAKARLRPGKLISNGLAGVKSNKSYINPGEESVMVNRPTEGQDVAGLSGNYRNFYDQRKILKGSGETINGGEEKIFEKNYIQFFLDDSVTKYIEVKLRIAGFNIIDIIEEEEVEKNKNTITFISDDAPVSGYYSAYKECQEIGDADNKNTKLSYLADYYAPGEIYSHSPIERTGIYSNLSYLLGDELSEGGEDKVKRRYLRFPLGEDEFFAITIKRNGAPLYKIKYNAQAPDYFLKTFDKIISILSLENLQNYQINYSTNSIKKSKLEGEKNCGEEEGNILQNIRNEIKNSIDLWKNDHFERFIQMTKYPVERRKVSGDSLDSCTTDIVNTRNKNSFLLLTEGQVFGNSYALSPTANRDFDSIQLPIFRLYPQSRIKGANYDEDSPEKDHYEKTSWVLRNLCYYPPSFSSIKYSNIRRDRLKYKGRYDEYSLLQMFCLVTPEGYRKKWHGLNSTVHVPLVFSISWNSKK